MSNVTEPEIIKGSDPEATFQESIKSEIEKILEFKKSIGDLVQPFEILST